LWREAWDLIGDLRRGRDAVLTDGGEGEIEICCDQFRLVQVFRNIFENALAACSDPVRVEIKAELAANSNPPLVRVRLRDNGPGISAHARNKLFEPFFTTKPKGTGLGLSIAQRVVEAHGGKIELGRSSSGAEFVLTLPLPEQAAQSEQCELAGAPTTGRLP
jgi:signal transduction histidine kinase